MKRIVTVLLILLAIPALSLAQRAVSQADVVEMTAEIVAIDKDARMVTLEDEDGEIEEVFCGPEVKRFDELKVGDKVTFRYYESIVSQIRKPGQAAAAASAGTGDPKVVRGTGNRPGATASRQETITVLSEDGRTLDFKVEDPKNLTGVKVGDKVDITYTAAVMITVK